MPPLWRVKSLVIQEMSTLWSASMKDIESIDFMYVFVNMVYEPWFWVVTFFAVGFGLMAISYFDKSGRKPPDGI